MLEITVVAPLSEPTPTLTFSRPNPVTSAEPDTMSIATPVLRNETSSAVRLIVERIPVAVLVNNPESIDSVP